MSVHDQRVDEIAAGLSTATRAEAESMAHELATYRAIGPRLTASAPDMLEALRKAVKQLEDMGSDGTASGATAAIAKATGEPS